MNLPQGKEGQRPSEHHIIAVDQRRTPRIPEDLLDLAGLMPRDLPRFHRGIAHQALAERIAIARNSLDALEQAFGSAQQDALRRIATALGQFEQTVQAFKAATADIARTRQEMTDQQGEIVRISETLYKFQMERMAIESAQARSLQIGATLLALLFGVLAAWVITRQIVNPLQHTLQAVNRIAQGDLTEPVKVDRRDELGQLQSGLAQMMHNLHELIDGIRSGVIQVASAAEPQLKSYCCRSVPAMRDCLRLVKGRFTSP